MRLEKLDLDDISYDKYACSLFPASLIVSFDFFKVCQNREAAVTNISSSQSGLHSFLRFIANICPDIRHICILSVRSVIYSHIFDEQKYNFLPVEICQRISRIKQNREKKWESYSMVRSTMLPRMSVNTHELFFVSRYVGWETIHCCRW